MRNLAYRSAFVLLCTVAALAAGCSSSSSSARDCVPQVRDGWVRMPPAGAASAMPMLAGFGRIVNTCPTPVTIVGTKSPSFAGVELHETRTVDGVNRMRPVPELRIAPDDSAVLKPGGLHLMLMRPDAKLNPGSRVVVQFELAGGGTLLGEFEVRKAEP